MGRHSFSVVMGTGLCKLWTNPLSFDINKTQFFVTTTRHTWEDQKLASCLGGNKQTNNISRKKWDLWEFMLPPVVIKGSAVEYCTQYWLPQYPESGTIKLVCKLWSYRYENEKRNWPFFPCCWQCFVLFVSCWPVCKWALTVCSSLVSCCVAPCVVVNWRKGERGRQDFTTRVCAAFSNDSNCHHLLFTARREEASPRPTLTKRLAFIGCRLDAGGLNELLLIKSGLLSSNEAVKREIRSVWSQSKPVQALCGSSLPFLELIYAFLSLLFSFLFPLCSFSFSFNHFSLYFSPPFFLSCSFSSLHLFPSLLSPLYPFVLSSIASLFYCSSSFVVSPSSSQFSIFFTFVSFQQFLFSYSASHFFFPSFSPTIYFLISFLLFFHFLSSPLPHCVPSSAYFSILFFLLSFFPSFSLLSFLPLVIYTPPVCLLTPLLTFI